MPPHKQGGNIRRSMDLHHYENPRNEQITNRSEVFAMSAAKSESEQGARNESEQGARNEEHLRNTTNEAAGRDRKYNAETLGGDSEVFSLSLNNSLGVDNKGFDCNDKESTFCSSDQVTVAKADEVNMNDVLPKSSEQNHDVAVSETVTDKKPSVVSCDPVESALPATPRPKTVRAWLKDPHLYKVIPLFHSQLY